jgi:hypothetical protein
MKSKLTSEDVAWLEQRLSTAMAPVQPRAEFVHDAKRALLTLPPDEEDQSGSVGLAMISAMLIGFGLALLIVAIVRRRRYWLS